MTKPHKVNIALQSEIICFSKGWGQTYTVSVHNKKALTKKRQCFPLDYFPYQPIHGSQRPKRSRLYSLSSSWCFLTLQTSGVWPSYGSDMECMLMLRPGVQHPYSTKSGVCCTPGKAARGHTTELGALEGNPKWSASWQEHLKQTSPWVMSRFSTGKSSWSPKHAWETGQQSSNMYDIVWSGISIISWPWQERVMISTEYSYEKRPLTFQVSCVQRPSQKRTELQKSEKKSEIRSLIHPTAVISIYI